MSNEQQYIRSKDVENRASFGQKLLWQIESIAWDVIYWGPFKMMGVDRASNFGGWFFKKLGPLTSTHKTALKNLRMAFPDWSEEQVEATAMEAWECFGRTAGELPHLPKIDPYEENGRVEIVGLENLDAIRDSEKGAVMVSGHFANWEVMAATICNRVEDAYITYRALNNPHIDRKLNKVRHDYGTAVLTPKGIGTREVMKALKDNKAVGLMNDQKFNQGISVPFFGIEAMTAPGPSRLAIKYDVPIVPFSTVRTGPGRFRVTVHDAIVPQKTGDLEADIYATVEQINAFMEARVRETPGQWFWMHRRWPKEAWRDAGVA
ncbi:lysophospholipid acyltransferase family protein [Ponticaulis sp.]|uniref:lysophospholipid acyltransferase family protein n=1 Tax=Ponticaulis sp. TaxID=2020902 RepID=UPI000C54338B|nr:lysophospholipid acyltransferase family protein [Ponticaulis sp.]MBN03873.1 lipid A biosynthesis acyltransferase [Ponticaulis sp.]